MTRRLVVLVVALLLGGVPLGALAQRENAPTDRGRTQKVIVEVAPRANPRTVARQLGATPTFVYENAINGFAAELPAQVVEALARSGSVLRVTPDLPVEATVQTTPSGVNRIDTEQSSLFEIDQVANGGVDADIAVLDTGIAPHPDLFIKGGVACIGRGLADGDGHGTHVAGTAGARDNTAGVVGVAPGVRLWAVKVLNDNGSGTFGSIVCGLDYVYANRATIDVVNMSLGGTGVESTCQNDGFHRAVCSVVDRAGIPVVVAAGNESAPANAVVPANFDEAITVSAFADADGKPGQNGPITCAQNADDAFSRSYSNYGPEVDIAAPGDCIVSTWLGGRYRRLTGTSMAAPHVAGAAALFLSTKPNATPEQVRSWLLNQASVSQTSPRGFLGDADGSFEPVLYLGPDPEAAP